MFDKPFRVKAGEVFCCVCEFRTGNTHYGSNGVAVVQGEGDVTFTFSECVGSANGTGTSQGQVPEIYYYA